MHSGSNWGPPLQTSVKGGELAKFAGTLGLPTPSVCECSCKASKPGRLGVKVMLSQILDGPVRSVQLQLDSSRWCIIIHSGRPLYPIETTTFLTTCESCLILFEF